MSLDNASSSVTVVGEPASDAHHSTVIGEPVGHHPQHGHPHHSQPQQQHTNSYGGHAVPALGEPVLAENSEDESNFELHYAIASNDPTLPAPEGEHAIDGNEHDVSQTINNVVFTPDVAADASGENDPDPGTPDSALRSVEGTLITAEDDAATARSQDVSIAEVPSASELPAAPDPCAEAQALPESGAIKEEPDDTCIGVEDEESEKSNEHSRRMQDECEPDDQSQIKQVWPRTGLIFIAGIAMAVVGVAAAVSSGRRRG